jgi:hypothetical protein
MGRNTTRANEEFPAKEAKDRFEAALRGARIAGPQHKESVTPKATKKQRAARKPKAKSSSSP